MEGRAVLFLLLAHTFDSDDDQCKRFDGCFFLIRFPLSNSYITNPSQNNKFWKFSNAIISQNSFTMRVIEKRSNSKTKAAQWWRKWVREKQKKKRWDKCVYESHLRQWTGEFEAIVIEHIKETETEWKGGKEKSTSKKANIFAADKNRVESIKYLEWIVWMAKSMRKSQMETTLKLNFKTKKNSLLLPLGISKQQRNFFFSVFFLRSTDFFGEKCFRFLTLTFLATEEVRDSKA